MPLFRQEPLADGGWRRVLEILWSERDYEHRIDAVLATAAELCDLPSCHLYVADDSGRRFRLERSRTAVRAGAVAPGFEAQTEGGAEAMGPTPPLELARSAEDATSRVVITPAGQMWSVPLARDGDLLGLLQVGPVEKGGPGGHARRRLDAALFPLALVVEQARGAAALRRELAALSAQVEVGRKLAGSALDVERFVTLLLTLALKATRTAAGFVAIVEPRSGQLAVRAQSGLPEGFVERLDLAPETGLFDWATAEGGALILRDFEAAGRLGVRSILAVPLVEGVQPLGIFALLNFGEGGTFDEASLELLGAFAEQIRLMLHNARLFRTFSDQYLETLTGLARSLDLRRPHTHGHHARVSRAAGALARRLGLPPEEAAALEAAGLIHDVGMAGIAGVEGGFEADVEHPTVGASLIETLPLHPAVAEAVASHHEWFDGWGFPRGLRGEQIPLAGRVLGAAELLVELASGDPMRAPWPAERLLAELELRRGSQLDPQVADAAILLVREGGLPIDSQEEEPWSTR